MPNNDNMRFVTYAPPPCDGCGQTICDCQWLEEIDARAYTIWHNDTGPEPYN